ncbi:MAG: DUF952 domain-containing protein [Flavobacteriales bacterium]
MNHPYIYHICEPHEWIERVENGLYYHPSLDEEGFIHCSTEAQLQPTIERFFKESPKLIILQIDCQLLEAALKYELAKDLNEYFPHIYGPLNIDAVVHVDSKRMH